MVLNWGQFCPPGGHLAMSGDTQLSQLVRGGPSNWHLADRGQGTLLHVLQCTGQPSPQHSSPNVGEAGCECYTDGWSPISLLQYQPLWNRRFPSVATAFVLWMNHEVTREQDSLALFPHFPWVESVLNTALAPLVSIAGSCLVDVLPS